MFGTNKLCMKGIYLPTFQRSIILRANEGYKKITQLFTQLENLWRGKLVSLLVSLYIYYTDFIQIFLYFARQNVKIDFSLFRQIKRQDTVSESGLSCRNLN